MIHYQDGNPLALEGSGLAYKDAAGFPEPHQGSINKEKEDNTVGRESMESHTELEP